MASDACENAPAAVVPPGATALEAFVLMLQERVAALELAHAHDVAAREAAAKAAEAKRATDEAFERQYPTPLLSELTTANLAAWRADRSASRDARKKRWLEIANPVHSEAEYIAVTLLENDDPDGTWCRIHHPINLQRLRTNGFTVMEVDVPRADMYSVKSAV
jgi:hypothetical protein